MRAIGRDMRTSLPGLYWLNVFGPQYVDLIGERRILRAPADSAERCGDHVVVRTYCNAEDWEAQTETRHLVAAALGAEYFFDRDDPARPHHAPDFGLPELPELPPFRVQAEHGSFSPRRRNRWRSPTPSRCAALTVTERNVIGSEPQHGN
jgi:hypothetical protein